MAKVDISFKGIHRNTNEGICNDGECMKLMNMTATKEGLKVLPMVSGVKTFSTTYRKIFYHSLSGHYLGINSDGDVKDLGADFSTSTIVYNSSDNGDAIDIQFVGNIMCVLAEGGTSYYIWKGSSYTSLGSKIPTPVLKVSNIEMRVEDVIEHNVIDNTEQYANGLCARAHSALTANGFYIDRAFFRVGVRLFDGSYVSVSPIYCVEPTEVQNESVKSSDGDTHYVHRFLYDAATGIAYGLNDVWNMPTTLPTEYIITGLIKDQFNFLKGRTSSSPFSVWAAMCGFKPTFAISNISDFSSWGDLIAGIDVFTTGSIERHELTTSYNSNGSASDKITYLPSSDYDEKVKNRLRIFRKCASFDKSGALSWSVSSTDADAIQVQEALVDVGSNSTFKFASDSKSIVYNSRLHIANYTEELPLGYKPSDYLNFAQIARKDDSYEYISFTASGDPYTAFRLPIYDYADCWDADNGVYSAQTLYRYKAWVAYNSTNTQGNYAYHKKIVFTVHPVNRQNEEDVDSIIAGVYAYPRATSYIASSYSKNSGGTTSYRSNMFRTINCVANLTTSGGSSTIKWSDAKTPVHYSNPVVSFPDIRANTLSFYDTTSKPSVTYNSTKYWFCESDVEIVARTVANGSWGGVWFKWKSQAGDVIFSDKAYVGANFYKPTYKGSPYLGNNTVVKVLGTTIVNPTVNGAIQVSTSTSTNGSLTNTFTLENIGTSNIAIGTESSYEVHYGYGRSAVSDTSNVPTSSNTSLAMGNVLKVSEIDNPLYFPPSQTYQPSTSKIIDLSVNNEALSEGQHGENPLYVFTESCIKAMVVDRTGKTVYPAIDDVSNDVSNGTSTSIPDGVVFSTGRGLKLIRGKKVINISEALEGEDSIVANGASNGTQLDLWATISGSITSSSTDVVAKLPYIIYGSTQHYDVNFIVYLMGASLGYSYLENLLLVSNTNYGYSYVYNFTSGEWSQVSFTFNGTVSGSKTFLLLRHVSSNTQIVSFDRTYTNSPVNNRKHIKNDCSCYFITRPIKFTSPATLKKVSQYAFHAFMRTKGGGSSTRTFIEGEYYPFGDDCYIVVLGSMDGLSYQVCGVKQVTTAMNEWVSQLYRTNSYRFYMVMFGATEALSSHSIISGMTFDVEEVYAKRMR